MNTEIYIIELDDYDPAKAVAEALDLRNTHFNSAPTTYTEVLKAVRCDTKPHTLWIFTVEVSWV